MKSSIAFCAGLMTALSLAASQAWAEGGKRVAFLDGPIADKYIGGMTRSFTETAKTLGLDVSVVQSPFDPALQAQQLDDAIAKKVDAIVMMIMSQKALIPALTRAKEAHIPVILINTIIPQDDLYTAFVGEDSAALGGLAGEAMADGLAKSGRTSAKVAVVAGSMDEGIAPARAAAFKKELEAHPGMSVVAIEETHWAPPEAEKAAGQLLARFSGQGGTRRHVWHERPYRQWHRASGGIGRGETRNRQERTGDRWRQLLGARHRRHCAGYNVCDDLLDPD